MDYVDKVLRAHGTMIGRMLIGLLFVFSGIGIVLNGVESFSKMIEMRGLPMPIILASLVVVWKISAGSALILGWRTAQAALALIIFTALATLLYHLDLNDVSLFKNLAIIGGLLYVYVYGPGNGWKLKTS